MNTLDLMNTPKRYGVIYRLFRVSNEDYIEYLQENGEFGSTNLVDAAKMDFDAAVVEQQRLQKSECVPVHVEMWTPGNGAQS